jgi:serine/threonine-protein kinase
MLNPGDELGSYRIVELIGEGGMAFVYRAEHQRLGRRVAIKILKPELAYRPDVGQRFFAEARAVNDIGHPHIVDIYDFVEDREQNPPLVYMVMELLEGRSLAAEIERQGPLPPSDVVAIGTKVIEALIAVHGRKILHRDLKTENIFVLDGADRSGASIKLLDFGAVKLLDDNARHSITDPGVAVGTPAYMPPETAFNKRLDERADIYAMGVVLYKMLTARLPFDGDSFGALMANIVRTEAPPIAATRGTSGPVPPGLEAVVRCCLEKRPEDRFQSMRELRTALTAALDPAADELDVEVPDATEVMGLDQLRPRARPLLLIGAAALLLAGAVAILVAMPSTDEGARARAPAPPVTVEVDQTAVSEQVVAVDGGAEAVGDARPELAPESAPKRRARRAKTRRDKKARRRRGARRRNKAGDKQPSNLQLVDPFAK